MDPAASAVVAEAQLRISSAPVAELAEGALTAQARAGLETADFVIIAVTPGTGKAFADELDLIAAAQRAARYVLPA